MHETHRPEPEVEPPRPQPRVWIGSWLDYNDGQLHGEWINAGQDDEAIERDIGVMLARSPTARATGQLAEDWGVFDFDEFGPVRVDEQAPISWIGVVGRGITEYGQSFAAYAAATGDVEALADYQNAYLGQWESVQAYADSFVDDAGYNQILDDALPDSIRSYVSLDTSAIARDLELSGDIHAVPDGDGGVWLFAAT